MLIPNGPKGSDAEGFPTLYPSRLRAYGAAPPHDRYRGCPAQYRARYVDCVCGHPRADHHDGADACVHADDPREGCLCLRWRTAVVDVVEPNAPREFGGAIHDALFHMEEHAVGPEEALQAVWEPSLDADSYQDAVEVLDSYLARGGPMAKYGTLAVEIELVAPLYVDEDFGPVYAGGIIDWLGVDVNETQIIHMVDYKSNARPLDPDEVRKDLQMREYDWLIHQCWAALGLPGRPHTVAHMDGIRWNDVEVRYTDGDRAAWQEWAIAVARRILRDDRGAPQLTTGCRWCPVRLDCPAYLDLPGVAQSIAARSTVTSLDDLWAWRKKADEARKVLEEGVKDVDRVFRERVIDEGPVSMDGQVWREEDDLKDTLDMEQLHDVLGDALFYDIANATKKDVEQIARAHPDKKAAIMDCYTKLITGKKVTRKKAK